MSFIQNQFTALATCPRVKVPGSKHCHIPEPLWGFQFGLGCGLIASQDFIILSFCSCCLRSQISFPLMFTLFLELHQPGRDFWRRKKKLPSNNPNTKKEKRKILSPAKATIFMWRKSLVREQEKTLMRMWLGTPKCCWERGPCWNVPGVAWGCHSLDQWEQTDLGTHSHHIWRKFI